MSLAERLPDTPAGRLVASKRVLIIAHRGNSKHAPENTLPAFHSAVKVGADLVELDYFTTQDGHAVAFHDKDLDRTTDAVRRLKRKGVKVSDLSLDELRRLDAGSWFDSRFTGARIPTLTESIDVIQKGGTTLIEHKHGTAEACVKLLREEDALQDVIVQSFDWKYVTEIRRCAPSVVTAAVGGKEFSSAKLDQIGKTGAAVVGWDHREIGRTDIAAIHARGLKIWLYTVNDPRRAWRLIDQGVDGLITDDPAAMLHLRDSLSR